MNNKPKIPFEIQKKNFDTIADLMDKYGLELDKKYDFPVVIQKNNEVIVSDVFPITFEYDERFECIKVYIDTIYVKCHFQKKYGIYLYHNTDFDIFEYNEEFDKLMISNKEFKTTYTIFFKRFDNSQL